MQDSEEHYIPRQKVNQSSDEDVEQEEPSRVPARSSRVTGRQSTEKRRIVSHPPPFLLPERGLQYTLIAGVIGGILDVLVNIAITIPSTARNQTASTIFGLLCLNLFITVLIFGVTGYIVGKFAVQRRLGFLAGAIIGAIAYFVSFLVRYIPSYPGNTVISGATNAATIGIALLLLLLSALLGGLISLFGAWLATRRQ